MADYNDGKPTDIEDIPQEELSLAVKDWSEGSKSLEDAMTACIDSGIPTYASCKGHRITDKPYLSLVITKENIGQILNIMNEVNKKRNIEIRLSYLEATQRGGKPVSICTIYSGMLNRDTIFRIIEQASQENIELEEADDDVRTMMELHKTLRTNGQFGTFNMVTLKKGLVSKDMYITNIYPDTGLEYKYNDYKLKQKKGSEYMEYHIGKDKETIHSLIEDISEDFTVNDKDDLFPREGSEEGDSATERSSQRTSFVPKVPTPIITTRDGEAEPSNEPIHGDDQR